MRNLSHPPHTRDISSCWFEWGRWGQRHLGNLEEEGRHQGPKAADRRREKSRGLGERCLGSSPQAGGGPAESSERGCGSRIQRGEWPAWYPSQSMRREAPGSSGKKGVGLSSAVRKAGLTVGDQWTGRREGEKGEREGFSGGAGRKEVTHSLPRLTKAAGISV